MNPPLQRTKPGVLAPLAAGLFALAAAAPTPTPTPRLSGGFGRTAVTPGASPRGQSLADVVSAAGETRGRSERKKPAVRITNESLVTEPGKGKLTTSEPRVSPPSASKAPVTASKAAAPAAAAPAATPPTAEGESYWREEARRARQRVADLEDTITRLEANSKRLEADFYAWDDGAYRDRVIKPAWDRAREELATARKELPAAERDLADLPDRARRAGALPGWLRE